MSKYTIVSARIEVSATDAGPVSPVPPQRVTHAELTDRVVKLLSDRLDALGICDAVLHSGEVEAPNIESAAVQAFDRLQQAFIAQWNPVEQETVGMLPAPPVYRYIPPNQHEVIGWVTVSTSSGGSRPLEYRVREGNDEYRCLVCAAVGVLESQFVAARQASRR